MHLKRISLVNFKNYTGISLDFSNKINCFIGENGEGKTNLLDAVFYLSFCKSYFNSVDSNNILHGEDFFSITGVFQKNGAKLNDTVQCVQRRNQRKQFKVNGKEYERLADHIGLYPVVMVSPADQELVTGGSDDRRKFLDRVISQFDKAYLDNLINYNKALLQRNRLLKQFGLTGTFDEAMVNIWDEQLVKYGSLIFEKRKSFVADFGPLFNEYYSAISGDKEKVYLEYESQLLNKNYKELIEKAYSRDRALEYTSVGVHKDDIDFRLGDFPLKVYGSQGQQKSFILAVRLAQFVYTYKLLGFKPVVLLDDIFDKLDDIRVSNLIRLVSGDDFGQIFITDTQYDRIKKIFELHDTGHKIFMIKSGNAKETEL